MKIFAFIVVFITLIFVLPSSIIDTTIAILFGLGMFGMFLGAACSVLNIATGVFTKK
ncbi:hypothetical protein [Campylobacter mucosalis]|uniref:Uncharacterized protein n=1 Tax=Campylobacter mucosalis CCUG 21559 TaxID=1032067 RepID=A0A6G5QGV3_9BACT|nr:hypothetical protein [Campylobacter mucosalis]QCD44862.1 hypothetical protein CMUC_1082 [Campylobacter mucosalis CCUG 21559]